MCLRAKFPAGKHWWTCSIMLLMDIMPMQHRVATLHAGNMTCSRLFSCFVEQAPPELEADLCELGTSMAYNPDTLSFTVPDTDQIYIEGLAAGVTEEDVATHFASIGVLKQVNVQGDWNSLQL